MDSFSAFSARNVVVSFFDPIYNEDNGFIRIRLTSLVPGDFNGTKKAIVNDGLETYQKNLAAFVEETGIDGINYDWEYPQLPHEWNACSKLLIASKAAIQGRDLSVAL